MAHELLRLGVSTAGLSRSLPEEILKALRRQEAYTAAEADTLRLFAQEYGNHISRSLIRSLEYFMTVPMLNLGLDHPGLAMVKGLTEHQEIWSVHSPFDGVDLSSLDDDTRSRSVDHTLAAAQVASQLGASVLTIHAGRDLPEEGPRSARIDACVDSITTVADVCAPMALRLAVELLPRDAIGNCVEELTVILDRVNRPNVGVCLDTTHTFPAGIIPDVIRTLGPRLITLHISDHDGQKECHWLPKLGVIDWKAVIGALVEVGYAGPFLYELPLVYPEFADAISTLETNYQQLMAAAGIAR